MGGVMDARWSMSSLACHPVYGKGNVEGTPRMIRVVLGWNSAVAIWKVWVSGNLRREMMVAVFTAVSVSDETLMEAFDTLHSFQYASEDGSAQSASADYGDEIRRASYKRREKRRKQRLQDFRRSGEVMERHSSRQATAEDFQPLEDVAEYPSDEGLLSDA